MADGQIKADEVIDDGVIERLEQVVNLFDEIVLRFDQVEKRGRSASNSISFADAEKENTEAVKKSKQALSEYEKVQKQLEKQEERRVVAQTRLSRRLAEQRVETQRLNRETKRNAVINNTNERAYRRLSTLYAKQKQDLKDLVVLYGENSREVLKFSSAVEKTGQKIKVADNIAGDFQRNVGNYPNSFRPAITVVKQLIGAFGVVEGLRLGFRLVRDLSNIAREAKGVDFAFKQLGRTGEDSFERIRERTKGLFSDLDIKQAIVEFDNFRLSAEQLDKVFEFIAVRSAQTGKSFEFLRNSAIEAITKESILRADNLGISQASLNEELAKGVDFLTAFGNVAEREIERAGNILDEASNGGQKFTASLENIKKGVGENINTFKGFGVVNDFLDRTNTLVKVQGEFLNGNVTILERLKAGYGFLTTAGAEENRRLLEEIDNRKELKKEIDAQIKAYGRLNNISGQGPLQQGQGNNTFLNIPFEEENAIRTLDTINAEMEKYNDILQETSVTDIKKLKSTADRINALQKEKDAILDLIETEKSANKSKEEFVRTFNLSTEEGLTSAIQLLDQQQKLLEIGGDEWQELGKQAENYRKLLKRLKDDANLTIDDISFIDSDAAQDALDVENFLNTEGIEQGFKSLSETLGVDQKELVEEFEKYYKQDFESFLKYSELKAQADKELEFVRREALVGGLGVAQDFAQAFFDVQSNRIEEEIEKQNEAFDNVVNNKNSSEEAIAIAEEKRERNEKRLEKLKEKRQRKAFLLQQAIEVAKVIIAGENAALAALTLPPIGLGPIGGAPFALSARINAALAVGTILAQSIPQFFKGKSATDNYQGYATVNELPGQREYRVTEEGVIQMFPKGKQTTYVKGSDIIEKSKSSLKTSLQDKNSEVFKRVVGSKYSNDTQSRMQIVHMNGNNNSFDEKGIEKAILRGMKKAKLKVENTVYLEQNGTNYFLP